MGGRSGRHCRCALASRLARRSSGVRGAALGRHPVRGRVSRRGGGRLAGAHRDQRARGRADGFGRTSPGNDGAGSGVCRRRARPPGIASLCGGSIRRRTARVAYPVAVAAAASGHGLPLDASLEAFVLAQVANLVSAALRLGADRADGRPEDSRRAPAAHSGSGARGSNARASPTSAAARSAPTSPPCVTRRNIRGCSGHDHEPATSSRRHRRPGRLGQDGAHGAALQAPARRVRASPPSPTTSTPRRTPAFWSRPARFRLSGSSASRPAAARIPRSARTPRSISRRFRRCASGSPISI